MGGIKADVRWIYIIRYFSCENCLHAVFLSYLSDVFLLFPHRRSVKWNHRQAKRVCIRFIFNNADSIIHWILLLVIQIYWNFRTRSFVQSTVCQAIFRISWQSWIEEVKTPLARDSKSNKMIILRSSYKKSGWRAFFSEKFVSAFGKFMQPPRWLLRRTQITIL